MPTPLDFDDLAAAIETRLGDDRLIVAIAGPPASGKSTLAERLAARLADRARGGAVVVGMDGFHLDDAVLDARGWRARKGAPHTFDVAGLRTLLERLRRNDETEIFAPRFDRDIEIARAGAVVVARKATLVLVEGNYLLSTAEPWPTLRPCFDVAVRLVLDDDDLRSRLMRRWTDAGLSTEEAERKIDENDFPNARFVIETSGLADLVATTA